MAWFVLVLSGVLEAVWATALGRSEGLTRAVHGGVRIRPPAQHGWTGVLDEDAAYGDGLRGVDWHWRHADRRLRDVHRTGTFTVLKALFLAQQMATLLFAQPRKERELSYGITGYRRQANERL